MNENKIEPKYGLDVVDKYKDTLINTLLGNKHIVKAISDTSLSPLVTGDYVPSSLPWTNVFPYPFLPDMPLTDKKVFLTLDVSVFSNYDSNSIRAMITIDVYMHKDLVKMLDINGDFTSRLDFISAEIYRELYRSRNFGTSNLKFSQSAPVFILENIPGRQLVFEVTDFAANYRTILANKGKLLNG